jgi:hypothetical protein
VGGVTLFALVHGAGGSGADWDLVADELRRRGHEDSATGHAAAPGYDFSD